MEQEESSSSSGTSFGGGWLTGLIQAVTGIVTVTTQEVTETKIQEKNLSLRRYLIENQQLPNINNLFKRTGSTFNPVMIAVFIAVAVALVMLMNKRGQAAQTNS